jgi:hypothetical protein
MKGMMLSMLSSAMTPGERPAPETACIEVMKTRRTPNARAAAPG